MSLALLTAEEARRAEEAHEGSLEELMERAGVAVAALVTERFPGAVTVVCGGGANGGDGRVCARLLTQRGRTVSVVERLGDLGEPDVIVDALLGTGLREAPREDTARMIESINRAGVPVVSVDLPSGVNASSGEVPGAAVQARATVTFGAAKVGLAVFPGAGFAGEVHVAPIGLAPAGHEHALLTASILAEVPAKSAQSTKYAAGRVLVVGGSPGLSGAPVLAALAALRGDAGYVTVAAPASCMPAIESLVVEAVKRPLPEDASGRISPRALDAILEAAARADAVALGPGLGRSEGTKGLVRSLLEAIEAPVVVDADALHDLEPFERAGATVLTPHSGELARLLGTTAAELDAHRLVSVRRAASLFGSVVVAKGPDTLIASPREGVLVAAYGRPSLATAGSGDVLAGLTAAFLAKGLSPRRAAGAAAVAHGIASGLVSPQRGMVASDLPAAIGRALEGEGAVGWPPGWAPMPEAGEP